MAKDNEILGEIRDHYQLAYDAAEPGYREMLDDLNFISGETQWPQNIAADRKADGRPCLTINKLASFADQVMGDLRQNSPSIKIKPVDSKADPDTAEVLTGLIRNIEVQSSAEIAYDTAVESAVICGKGTFRIITEYADDDVFEQDIRFKRMKNTFTVLWEPNAQEWDNSDANYCFVTERMSREIFIRTYPNASIQEFSGGRDKNIQQWGDDKTIRIAEYWVKKPEKKTLYLIQSPIDGNTFVTDDLTAGKWEFEPVILNSRPVETHRILWYKTNGVEILEGPSVWPGKYIPIFEVYGKELNIEGRTIHRGITRHAKDPARLYNYSRSHNAEVTALAPKSPYIVSAKMIANYQAMWNKAHKKNYPFLAVDADPDFPGIMPKREQPIIQNTGILAEISISDQEMHDTTGLQMANLGKERSREKSGIALREQKRQGQTGNFAYGDNLGRTLRYAGKVLVDLIPKIYDTARIVRVLGEDGEEKMVQLNAPYQDEKTGEERIHDLTTGKYDAVVTVGPSYNTQREEAAEGMIALFGNLPDQARMVIADLIVKNLDWPGAAELEKRLKSLLPPGLVDDGGPPPPPPPPDPVQMLEVEKLKAEVEKVLLQVQKEKVEIEQILIENRLKRNEAAQTEMGIDEILNSQGK